MKLKWLLAVIVLLGLVNYFRPLPQPQAIYDLKTPPAGKAAQVDWPAAGQAAIGAVGYGLLAESHGQKPVPMASTAKLMTALAIVKQQPADAGLPSQVLRFTAADVDIYRKYLANNGSVLPIKVGDEMTDYQALQAMLIPSGNNIADSLAIKQFGSIKNYAAYANRLAGQLGMTQSRFADASGFSAKTVSTAHNAALLINEALKNPLLRQVVRQKQFSFNSHVYKNTNWLLGADGINGIKTGHTDAAGGCYLFSSLQNIDGRKITVYGAVLGAADLAAAMNGSLALIPQIDKGFEKVTIIKQGETAAHYDLPWGGRVEAISQGELSILNWRGQPIKNTIDLPHLNTSVRAGGQLGKLSADAGGQPESVNLVLKSDAPQPSFFWRLLRI